MNKIPQEFIDLLGKVSDRELSKRSGISTYFFKVARESRDIPALHHGFKFPEEVIAQLGLVTDRSLHKRYGIPATVIHRERVKRSIPRFRGGVANAPDNDGPKQEPCEAAKETNPKRRKLPSVPLRAEVVSDLGKIPDKLIVEKHGYCISTIRRERIIRSIPSAKAVKVTLATDMVRDVLSPLLGKFPDTELARKIGVAVRYVRKVRDAAGIAPYAYELPVQVVEQLGTVPDSVLQKRYGVSVAVLAAARKKRGIASARGAKTEVWTPELISLLGKKSAREVSMLAGVGMNSVYKKRHELGLVTCEKVIWPDELVCLLGKVADTDLAAKSNGALSVYNVRNKRRALKIPPFGIRMAIIDSWTPQLLALLGKISDAELAGKSNGVLSAEHVRTKRRRLNIQRFKSPNSRIEKLTPELISLLGKVPDHEVAHRSEGLVSVEVVRRTRIRHGVLEFVEAGDAAKSCELVSMDKPESVSSTTKLRGRWTTDLFELLGKISDGELAERTGGAISLKSVRRMRVKNGIPACRKSKHKPTVQRQALRADVVDLMGTVSDYEISRRTGVARSEITRERLFLGIPAYSNTGRPPRTWLANEDQMIANMKDSQVAEALGISVSSVARRRLEMGALEG